MQLKEGTSLPASPIRTVRALCFWNLSFDLPSYIFSAVGTFRRILPIWPSVVYLLIQYLKLALTPAVFFPMIWEGC
jgi:hypothetical protein